MLPPNFIIPFTTVILCVCTLTHAYGARLPQTLTFYPAASNQSSRFYQELKDDLDVFRNREPEISSFLESCCEMGYMPPRFNNTNSLNQWPSSVIMTLVLDIPNLYFRSESSKELLLRSNLSIEAKAHFIQLMNDAYVSEVIKALATDAHKTIHYPVIKFTLLQKIIKGRISTVITWNNFNKLASKGILQTFFSQGLDINSVTTVVNNEYKLNLISQVLQQGERIIHQYLRKPICQILLNHIFRLTNYQPISAWKSKDQLKSLSPYIECLEPQMLPEKQQYDNWVDLFDFIVQSHAIDPAICILLLYKLDSHAWSRIPTETKFLCLRYSTPQMANDLLWHWEERYETELAIHGKFSAIQDMAFQNTLQREKESELSGIKRKQQLFSLICNNYIHLLSYDELDAMFGPYYVAIDWREIPVFQINRMDIRGIKQTLKYIKDHRLSPRSPWTEVDLENLGPLVIGLSSDEITKDHIRYFFGTGKKFIEHLGTPQKIKILALIGKEMFGGGGDYTLANIREYDISLLNDLSAYDLNNVIGRTFESGYFAYSVENDRLKERLPTGLLDRSWDARVSTIIYDNIVRVVSKSPTSVGDFSLTGPLSESMGSTLLGVNYKDLLNTRYSEWLSVINSFNFYLKDNHFMGRGLAQSLASYFDKVITDFFGPNKRSDRHMEPSFRMHMHLIGGRILREVDPNFLTNIPAYLCREAISMIGELDDNINLPRKMRQLIVQVYLSHCKRSPGLDFIDLVSLGSLVCDVPAEFLMNGANRTLLQERIHYFKRCSLSRLQGEALKDLLPTPILSYSNILNLQSAICSIVNAQDLWTLNETEKREIVPAIPYIWKDLHPFLFSSKIRYSDILWEPEEAYLEGLDIESQRSLGSCIRNTAWIYSAEYAQDTKYYYQKECLPDKSSQNKKRKTHTCSQIEDFGGAAVLLPEEYYTDMNMCQLQRCIYYLTTKPYMSTKVLDHIFRTYEERIQKRESFNDSLAAFATSKQPLLWYDLPVYTHFLNETDFPNVPNDIDFLHEVQKNIPKSMTPNYPLLEYLLSRYLKLSSKTQLKHTEIAALGNILCGATFQAQENNLIIKTKTNVAAITGADFVSSLKILGGLYACTDVQLQELNTFYLVNHKTPQKYSPADIVDLNLIISVIDPQQLNLFERDQIKMISCEAIRRISTESMNGFSKLFFLRLSPELIRCFTPNHWRLIKDINFSIVNNNLCSRVRFSDGTFSCMVLGNEFSNVKMDFDSQKKDDDSFDVNIPDVSVVIIDVEGTIDSSIQAKNQYLWAEDQYIIIYAQSIRASVQALIFNLLITAALQIR